MTDFVTIAILAKDKAHVLPLYLKCIAGLDYPKNKIHIYIKTNDNTDDTENILHEWVCSNTGSNTGANTYASIYFNSDNVDEILKNYKPHDWNGTRFKILAKIRQDSIEYAIKNNSNYFVVDVDNFVKPDTLINLINADKPVIGPFLKNIVQTSLYSNYHEAIDCNGYYAYSQEYDNIFNQINPNVHKVNVIHCTYYIKNEVLEQISYFDSTEAHEYVIFSRNLRKNNIDQFIDNRQVYGYLTFTDTAEDFVNEYSSNESFNKLFICPVTTV